MTNQAMRRAAASILALLALLVAGAATAQTQVQVVQPQPIGPNASFSDFLGLTDAELSGVQGKLTWLFLQSESIPYLAYAPSLGQIDPSLHAPFRRPRLDYGNDELPSDWVFTVTVDELRSIIRALNGVPAVAAGTVTGPLVSVSLLRQTSTGQVQVAESVVGQQDAVAAIDAILSALPAGHPGATHLTSLRNVVLGVEP